MRHDKFDIYFQLFVYDDNWVDCNNVLTHDDWYLAIYISIGIVICIDSMHVYAYH